MNPRFLLPFLWAAVALTVTPVAWSQVGASLAPLQLDRTAAELGPSASTTIRLTVQNDGQTQGQVSLGAQPPSGWKVTFSPAGPFSLAGGATQVVEVIFRTETNDVHPQSGTTHLTAQITDDVTRGSDTQGIDVTNTYQAPPLPIVPPAPAPDRTPVIVGSVLGLLALAGAGFYVAQARGVRLRIPQADQSITCGSDGVYPVQVENPTRRPQTVELRVREVPVGWVAAFSFPKVVLAPRDTTLVPLYVKVPAQAPAGATGRIRVQSRPNAWSPWWVQGHAVVHVRDVSSSR